MTTQPDEFDSATPPDEVLQDEQEDTPVLMVDVSSPVRTHELPARRFAPYTLNDVTATQGVHIDADPRRRSITLMGIGQAIRIGATQAAATDGSGAGGAEWPSNTALPLHTSAELWVAAALENVNISVIAEYWAD